MRYIEIVGPEYHKSLQLNESKLLDITKDLDEHLIIIDIEDNHVIHDVFNAAKVIDTFNSKEVRLYQEENETVFILGNLDTYFIFRTEDGIDNLMEMKAKVKGVTTSFLVWLTQKYKLHFRVDTELSQPGAKFFDNIASKGLLDAFIYNPKTGTKIKYEHDKHNSFPMYDKNVAGVDRPNSIHDPETTIWVFEQFSLRGGLLSKYYTSLPRLNEMLEKYPVNGYLPYIPPVSKPTE